MKAISGDRRYDPFLYDRVVAFLVAWAMRFGVKPVVDLGKVTGDFDRVFAILVMLSLKIARGETLAAEDLKVFTEVFTVLPGARIPVVHLIVELLKQLPPDAAAALLKSDKYQYEFAQLAKAMRKPKPVEKKAI